MYSHAKPRTVGLGYTVLLTGAVFLYYIKQLVVLLKDSIRPNYKVFAY
jgi:hypothetical protein